MTDGANIGFAMAKSYVQLKKTFDNYIQRKEN